jgi:hypothetical protein
VVGHASSIQERQDVGPSSSQHLSLVYPAFVAELA